MATETITERQERAGRNESLFRALNERLGGSPQDEETLHFFICECADPDCDQTVSLTGSEYEQVRSVSTHFVVQPGHYLPDVERVVSETSGRYAVVEKIERAAEAAAQFDPRRRERV